VIICDAVHVLDFAGVVDATEDVIVDVPIASVVSSVEYINFLGNKAKMKPLSLIPYYLDFIIE